MSGGLCKCLGVMLVNEGEGRCSVRGWSFFMGDVVRRR